MTRIVGCDSCGAHFYLDETLLRGAKRARIRCRKCGGPIEIGMPAPEPAPEEVRGSAQGAADADPSADAVFEDVRRLYASPPAPPVPAAVPEPPEAPARKRRSRAPLLVGLAALLGIAVAAVLYLQPDLLPFRPPAPAAPPAAKPAPAPPLYDAWASEGGGGKLASGEECFVLHGVVTNVGVGPSDGVLLKARLLGADNAVVAEGQSFAGTGIEGEELSRLTRAAVEERLARRPGEGSPYRRIPPGMAVPFTIVVFGPPGPVVSWSVEATDAPAPLRAP